MAYGLSQLFDIRIAECALNNPQGAAIKQSQDLFNEKWRHILNKL